MSARITIERILRDDDDISGQTIRQWKIEVEGRHIVVRDRKEHLPFLMLRPADIAIFVADLERARVAALELGTTLAPSDTVNSADAASGRDGSRELSDKHLEQGVADAAAKAEE